MSTVIGLPMLHAAGRTMLAAHHDFIELEDVAAICERIGEADALYAYPPLHVTRELIARAPRLKVIAAAGSGVDHIDVEAAYAAGIVVTHDVGAGAISVAEHAIGHMLCLAKRMVESDADVRRGRFDVRLDNRRYCEISGLALCIVGYGAVGAELARMAVWGFRMSVVAVNRTGQPIADPNVARTLPLQDALPMADIVSVHVPLTAATRHLIGEREFALMKPTAWLVDTSRSGVVDATALARALKRHRIAAAALDVFDPEPPLRNSALLKLRNVVVSPHCAGITRQSYERLAIAAATDIDDALRGVMPERMVDPGVWPGSRAQAGRLSLT